MIRNITVYHVFPLLLAVSIIFLIFIVLPKADPTYKKVTYVHEELVPNGLFANFDNGITSEMALMSSLNNPQQITLFGSSELNSESNYFPFMFLKDSLQLNCLAFGHAHHQTLSILCELMAGRPFLKNSKITILISPGWFEGTGTNPEAFLEFVKPNFLKRIVHDSLIGDKYKLHLGEYIHQNTHYFEGMTKELSYLQNYYLAAKGNFLSRYISLSKKHIQTIHADRYYIEDIEYVPASFSETAIKKWYVNTDSLLRSEQNKFLLNANNSLYVDQHYYDTYLLEKDGSIKKGAVANVDYLASPELKDFKLLIAFLKEMEVEASFVLLPLNPYYYENIQLLEPLVKELNTSIKANKFPLLDLTCLDKNNYTKGILKDVMHPGDYGWILINEFIYKTYATN